MQARRHGSVSARYGWQGALMLCGLLGLFYLFMASRSTLWDRDESRYATATLEMLQTGNRLYPTFNYALRPHKPVLIYWLMLAPLRFLGPTALAARLVSILAGSLACLVTYGLGRRLFSARAGWWAALLLGTCPLFVVNATAATTDATLVLTMLLACVPFVWAFTGGPRWWHVPVMGLALGAALLTKGPVGWAVPGLSMLAVAVTARGRARLAPRAWRDVLLASALGIALFLAWGLPANAATGGEFFDIGFSHRLSRRLFTAMEGHGGESWRYIAYLPFYLIVILVGTFPWSLILPASLRALALARLGGENATRSHGAAGAQSRVGLRVLLFGMLWPGFVLFTLVVSKLPHYSLPLFPWLAIVSGAWLTKPLEPGTQRDAAWIRHGVWGFAITGGALGIALLAGTWFFAYDATTRALSMSAGVVALATVGWAARAQWQGRVRRAVRIGLAGALLVFILAGLALPKLEAAFKLEARLVAALPRNLDASAPVIQHGWYEPSLHFYLGARRIERVPDPSRVRAWAEADGAGLLVITRRALEAIEAESGSLPLAEVAAVKGISHVKGDALELIALRRGSPDAQP